MVAGASLRVVFFGTPQFAVPTLDALVSSRHPVVAVAVTCSSIGLEVEAR